MSSDSQTQQPTYIIPPPAAPNWRTPLLIGILVLLAATNIYLFVQLDRMRADNRAEMGKLRDDMNATVERVRLDSSEAVQHARRNLDTLQSQLEEQRRAADRAVGQAKVDAQKRVDALQTRVVEQQQKQAEVIAQVKQTADTATTKLSDVSNDVGTVKTDLGNTKSQLEQTIANLKRATGELDDHASLIATNGTELKALRELGERNYIEFNIAKQKEPTRVSDVMIKLKKADAKHNKFTIEITADDKTVERKDRSTNEPIQFLTSKARQPYEIVVNSVTGNKITGYLSTPKVLTPRPATGAGM
jgi:phage shock protein A